MDQSEAVHCHHTHQVVRVCAAMCVTGDMPKFSLSSESIGIKITPREKKLTHSEWRHEPKCPLTSADSITLTLALCHSCFTWQVRLFVKSAEF